VRRLQVNLSVTLGKPVIPLLLEPMSWPPPGAMGPIFSEYIYVKFFGQQAPADVRPSDDERYWPVDKFHELLMQLRYHIAPDLQLITDGQRQLDTYCLKTTQEYIKNPAAKRWSIRK